MQHDYLCLNLERLRSIQFAMKVEFHATARDSGRFEYTKVNFHLPIHLFVCSSS